MSAVPFTPYELGMRDGRNRSTFGYRTGGLSVVDMPAYMDGYQQGKQDRINEQNMYDYDSLYEDGHDEGC